MKTFRSAKVFVMAESVIFYAKWCDDYDSANGTSLRLVFVELYAFICLKFALQNVLNKDNFKVLFGKLLQAIDDSAITIRQTKLRFDEYLSSL